MLMNVPLSRTWYEFYGEKMMENFLEILILKK